MSGDMDNDIPKTRRFLAKKALDRDKQNNRKIGRSKWLSKFSSLLLSPNLVEVCTYIDPITTGDFEKELKLCRASLSKHEKFIESVFSRLLDRWSLPRTFNYRLGTKRDHTASSCPLLHSSLSRTDETTLSSASEITIWIDPKAILNYPGHADPVFHNSSVWSSSNDNLPCCFPLLFIRTVSERGQSYSADIADTYSAHVALTTFMKQMKKAKISKKRFEEVSTFCILIDADLLKVQSCRTELLVNKSSEASSEDAEWETLYVKENYSSNDVNAILKVLLNELASTRDILSQAYTSVVQRRKIRQQPIRKAKQAKLNDLPKSISATPTTSCSQDTSEKTTGLKRKGSTFLIDQFASCGAQIDDIGIPTGPAVYREPLVYAVVRINGVNVYALLDSGAEINVMDKELAMRIGLISIAETPRKLACGGWAGPKEELSGVIPSGEIEIGGFIVTTPIFLKNDLLDEIILGRPFERAAAFEKRDTDDGRCHCVVYSADRGQKAEFIPNLQFGEDRDNARRGSLAKDVD